MSESNQSQPRTEFGFRRTTCACADCAINCRHIPGFLIPADLNRIAAERGYSEPDVFEFAKRELLASAGTRVMKAGRVFTIRTLVPAQRADGACIYLGEQDRCTIHKVSPYGCAFFDQHMLGPDSEQRARRALEAVLIDAQDENSIYLRTWWMLERLGKRAPDLEKRRRALEAERKKLPPQETFYGYCYVEKGGRYFPPVTLHGPVQAWRFAFASLSMFPEVRITDTGDLIAIQCIDGEVVFPKQNAETKAEVA